MRVNLVTPFAEKDAVKALGARWDAARKVWYVVDAPDLAPFMRWIPDLNAAQNSDASSPAAAASHASNAVKKPKVTDEPPAITGHGAAVAHCGCDVLPWVDCVHTTTVMRG